MSLFVLDASYALTWCFPDRSTPNTDAALQRMESHSDNATVPWVWQVEVANALGKAVSRTKIPLPRALEMSCCCCQSARWPSEVFQNS